jgi:hypothetical protein
MLLSIKKNLNLPGTWNLFSFLSYRIPVRSAPDLDFCTGRNGGEGGGGGGIRKIIIRNEYSKGEGAH